MPEAPHTDAAHTPATMDEGDGPFWTASLRRRIALVLTVVLVLVLLAVIPPLVSINRYSKRVAASISGSLGRPVHFDSLKLHLLPLPGITIANFAVGESPDFGAEPVMRAQVVEARLRIGSLWRRRIEVSRIALESPSINLVRRRSDGAWNLQSILMQASQMRSAPTAQAKAGDAPRFPYVEATDARINIKSDDDKLPFALKETDLALWLPEPNVWHLRLSGKPVRTDTDVSDVGLLRVDATLGRARDLPSAPITLDATWKPTPLGEASKLAVGHDLGWRGDVAASATLKGTLGTSTLTADLRLLSLRRADFVPEHTAEVNAHCEATTGGLLRSLLDLRCAIPTRSDTSMFAAIQSLRQVTARAPDGSETTDAVAKPGVLVVQGQVPDLLNWTDSNVNIQLQQASPDYALAWLRLFSKRIPHTLSIGGTFSLMASRSALGTSGREWSFSAQCSCDLPGSSETARQSTGGAGTTQWLIGFRRTSDDHVSDDAVIRMFPAPVLLPGIGAKQAAEEAEAQPAPADGMWGMVPPPFPVDGSVGRDGYRLKYASRSMAEFAASLLPPLGDGMPAVDMEPGDLVADRPWNGTQTWTAVSSAPGSPAHTRRKR